MDRIRRNNHNECNSWDDDQYWDEDDQEEDDYRPNDRFNNHGGWHYENWRSMNNRGWQAETWCTKGIDNHVVVKIRHYARIVRQNRRGSGPEGLEVGASFSEKGFKIDWKREIEIR